MNVRGDFCYVAFVMSREDRNLKTKFSSIAGKSKMTFSGLFLTNKVLKL